MPSTNHWEIWRFILGKEGAGGASWHAAIRKVFHYADASSLFSFSSVEGLGLASNASFNLANSSIWFL